MCENHALKRENWRSVTFCHRYSCKEENVWLLSERVSEVTTWLIAQPGIRELKIGYFGASTGAALARAWFERYLPA